MVISLALILATVVVVGIAVHFVALQRERAAEAAAKPLGQIVTVDGIAVHALVQGRGPDLILLHGASGNLRDFLPLIDRLSHRFRVIAFDRPGQGWSASSPAGISLAGQSAILAKAAVALGVTMPILLGQSYGGAVALAWALQSPLPPRALVLVSAPSLPWQGALDIWYRTNESWLGQALAVPLVAAFVPKSHIDGILKDVFLPMAEPPGYGAMIGVGLSLRRHSLRANADQINALHADLTAQSGQYGTLGLPVELIHGDRDHIVPLTIHSHLLAGLIPDAVLTVLPTGHMPHHSHPDDVLAAIDRAALRARLR